MAVCKIVSFLIYYLAVSCFTFYARVSHLASWYKDWLFLDVKNNTIHDYVVVGAGSAGSILTARLIDSGARVLLIEAGGSPDPFFNIPVMAPLLLNTEHDWKYKTVPQRHACKGLINNASSWPAGKIFGGSSRLNSMVHVQGHRDDYESWFPDYQEHINSTRDIIYFSNQSWYSRLAHAFMEGASELSYPLRNINEKSWTGFMKVQVTARNGERWSTDRIINPRHKRLTLVLHSLVQKILFKFDKAVGVEYVKNNLVYRAFAKKGVILSAGAIGTPKLLMLSGIGPRKDLEELQINTIVDLPVGKHLMDHVITGLDLVTINGSEALSISDIINPYSAISYFTAGKGPWTFGGVDALGTLHTSSHQYKADTVPNLQVMVLPVGISQDNGILLRKHLGIPDQVFYEYFQPLVYKTAITIAPVLLHPKSHGSVKLASANPLDDPLIDPNYLSHKEDVINLIQGIEFVKRLINTRSMSKLGAELYKKPFPGCENNEFDTPPYWECYIRHLTLSTYHPVGTCGMGRIVDSSFRVYGTKNLYVVDASVFNKLPSGNINTPVIALAEKAAKLLLQRLKINRPDILTCHVQDIFFQYSSLYNK